ISERAGLGVAIDVGEDAIGHIVRQQREPPPIVTAVEQLSLQKQKPLDGETGLHAHLARGPSGSLSRLRMGDARHQLAVITRSQCRMNSNWMTSASTGRNARPGPA